MVFCLSPCRWIDKDTQYIISRGVAPMTKKSLPIVLWSWCSNSTSSVLSVFSEEIFKLIFLNLLCSLNATTIRRIHQIRVCQYCQSYIRRIFSSPEFVIYGYHWTGALYWTHISKATRRMATVDCFAVKAVNNVRSKPCDIFDIYSLVQSGLLSSK